MDDLKKLKIFMVIAVLLSVYLVLGLITNYIDSARITTGHEPKLVIKIVSRDGSKVNYYGLTYKIVRYVGVSPKEPFKNNIGVKMGSWFMIYKLKNIDPIIVEYDKKTIEIKDNHDVNYLSNILINSRYEEEVCISSETHKILYKGLEYYLKSDCKSIQKDDKQAELSREDLNMILEIIDKN